MKAILLAATLGTFALGAVTLPAVGQAAGLTFEQVQRKYRRMSPVFIEKCDRNGDGVFTNVELQCVSGIYQSMYIED